MSSTPSVIRTNKELLKALNPPVARFYPCDLHVHSIGSTDVCLAANFDSLPQELRETLIINLTPVDDQSLQPINDSTLPAPQDILLPLSKEPADAEKHDQQVTNSKYVQTFHRALCARRMEIAQEQGIPDSDNWAIVGITDHNTAHFSAALAAHAWDNRTKDRLIVIPGIELQVGFPFGSPTQDCQVHILCLYAPRTSASDIRVAINEARPEGTDTWDMGNPINVNDLPSFVQTLRSHAKYPAICVAAHVGSQKGIEREPKYVILAAIDAEIARLEGELERARSEGAIADERELRQRLNTLAAQRSDSDGLHLEVLKLIGRCGFDALQVRDPSNETHYRRLHRFRENYGRSVPIVCSDAHTPSGVFSCASGTPFAKLSSDVLASGKPNVFFDELRKRVLRFGETRTTYAAPKSVTHWVEGIEIVAEAENASHFWQTTSSSGGDAASATAFTLPLSRNLNCFVGGRGSGKSAGIEAIAFLTQPAVFNEAARLKEKDRPDWYGRAQATLRGCRVRLVWKTSGTGGIGTLPKRALFLTRYFDPDGRYLNTELRDAEGNAIVDDAVTPPQIRILRAHEIEKTAESDNLRRLFDDLCGERIEKLTAEITSLRASLSEQRATVMELCQRFAELTKEGSALRQYAVRKMQFEKVDQPELRAKYEKLDQADAIARTATRTANQWGDVSARSSLDDIEANVTQFFDSAEAELIDEQGIPHPGYEPLHQIVRESVDPKQPGYRETVIAGIATGQSAIDTFSTALNEVRSAAAGKYKAESDDLVRQGLPSGSSERDSKKRAFDDAEAALKTYNDLIQQIETLLKERNDLHVSLVSACKERTTLRKATAEAITAQLARDLDPTVLRIEIDARPLADMEELDEWLERNVDPVFRRFASHRRDALIATGIMPAVIREALLDVGAPACNVFCADCESAKDGRITVPEAQQILDTCRSRRLVPLDESADWTEDFRGTVPAEIRDGIIVLSVAAATQCLRMDEVLRLDEVVLNDLPEIRLNDRPNDPASVPRSLSSLSPGQRCSAILPILLLSGDYPLVIDQPEENLDNRLIRQVIVNILAAMKLKRQVIIATHNPNLPVLGDVEQCVVLQAVGRDLSTVLATGNLDFPEVSDYITDIMEGGREAFQYRQSIYQSHWVGAVDEQPTH